MTSVGSEFAPPKLSACSTPGCENGAPDGEACFACRDIAERRAGILRGARIPKRYVKTTFAAEDLASWVPSSRARAVAQHWNGSDRLLLRGPSGAGKTSLAIATFRNLVTKLDGIRSALFVSSFDLVEAGRAREGSRGAQLVERARFDDVVVIDDLGAEPADDRRTIPRVIFDRHYAERTTIVTTWCDDRTLVELYGGGVRRRIVDGALEIDLGEP